MTSSRIFTVEPIRDQDKVDLLSRHGIIFPLTDVQMAEPRPRPPMWNTYELSAWCQETLAAAGGFDYKHDYLALTGNYLGLATLLATLVAYSEQPYSIRCLSFSKTNSSEEFNHVVLEEACAIDVALPESDTVELPTP